MNILQAENISFSIGKKQLLHKIDIAVKQASFTAIIGPNGAGKTTLLNLLNGDTNPTIGNVIFQQQKLTDINRFALAQQRAILPQLTNIPFAIKVKDIVALGREPYRYEKYHQYNDAVIAQCLIQTDIQHLAEHYYNILSGGEQHRVQIARTLAQIYHTPDADLSEKILFLDEPTNHLDIRHQYHLMENMKTQQAKGLTIIAVMHDLSLALQYAEQIILLNQGQKVGSFIPKELVDSNALSEVYKMDMQIRWDNEWERYIIAPMMSN